MFFIPSDTKKPLLDWKDTRKLSWGILILFGGGMALANMLQENGVIDLLSKTFESFSGESLVVILTVLVVIAIYGTELMSNLALVAVFVPIVADFAMKTDFSIIQLCIPITLAASCAFMLPVGTPPNAIVFSSGKLTINQMAKTGFVLNLIAVVLIASVPPEFVVKLAKAVVPITPERVVVPVELSVNAKAPSTVPPK